VIQRSSDFRRTFLKFDQNGDGKLSIIEFSRVRYNFFVVLLYPSCMILTS